MHVFLFAAEPEAATELKAEVERRGGRLQTATTATQGLSKLARSRPGLIFIDIALPDDNGLLVCNRLKKSSIHGNTPVIVIAGASDEAMIQRHRRLHARADRYLRRPLTREAVADALETYFDAQTDPGGDTTATVEPPRGPEPSTPPMPRAPARLPLDFDGLEEPPPEASSPAALPALEREPPTDRALRVAFADASRTVRTAALMATSGFDVQLRTHASGDGLLKGLRAEPPQVVVIDVDLPDIDGYALCKEIRSDSAFAELPVVLLWGESHPYDGARGAAAGATHDLKKPFDSDHFYKTLTALVAGVEPPPADLALHFPALRTPQPVALDEVIEFEDAVQGTEDYQDLIEVHEDVIVEIISERFDDAESSLMAPASLGERACRIFMFESDRALVDELKARFAAYDCTFDVTNDGVLGLAAVTQTPPDLILLTVELPGANGFKICADLKKSPSHRSIPVILLSSRATEESFEQHRKLRRRADDYLRKPFDFETLLEKIRGLVELRELPGPTGEEPASVSPGEPARDDADASRRPAASPPTGTPSEDSVLFAIPRPAEESVIEPGPASPDDSAQGERGASPPPPAPAAATVPASAERGASEEAGAADAPSDSERPPPIFEEETMAVAAGELERLASFDIDAEALADETADHGSAARDDEPSVEIASVSLRDIEALDIDIDASLDGGEPDGADEASAARMLGSSPPDAEDIEVDFDEDIVPLVNEQWLIVLWSSDPAVRGARYNITSIGVLPDDLSDWFELSGEEWAESLVTIGRSRKNRIVVRDPRVSSWHLRIQMKDGKFFVQDLGSASGTWVNDRRVEREELHGGEIIRFGGTVAKFINDVELSSSFGEVIRQFAETDWPTGTLQRHVMRQRLEELAEEAAREDTPLSVVGFGIDGIRPLACTLGDLVVDCFVEEIGQRIKALCPNRLVGRNAGVGFLVALPGEPAEAAYRLADDVRATIAREPLDVGTGPTRMTLSGAALGLGKGEDIESALREINTLIYEAQESGGDRVLTATAAEVPPFEERPDSRTVCTEIEPGDEESGRGDRSGVGSEDADTEEPEALAALAPLQGLEDRVARAASTPARIEMAQRGIEVVLRFAADLMLSGLAATNDDDHVDRRRRAIAAAPAPLRIAEHVEWLEGLAESLAATSAAPGVAPLADLVHSRPGRRLLARISTAMERRAALERLDAPDARALAGLARRLRNVLRDLVQRLTETLPHDVGVVESIEMVRDDLTIDYRLGTIGRAGRVVASARKTLPFRLVRGQCYLFDSNDDERPPLPLGALVAFGRTATEAPDELLVAEDLADGSTHCSVAVFGLDTRRTGRYAPPPAERLRVSW